MGFCSFSMKIFVISILLLYTNSLRTLKFLDVYNPCRINSHVIALDNVRSDKYDLLISMSTDHDCKFSCSMDNSNTLELPNEKINSVEKLIKDVPTVKKVDSYEFYGRHYYFYKISDLQNFIEYKYKCGEMESNKLNTYEIKFPKNNFSQTKILTFGDWSKHLNGLKTFEYLTKKIDYSKYDAFVTLGDYSYNMGSANNPSWDQGNIFFDWITPVSSKMPFMMNAGNHEFIKGNFEHFTKRFLMPNKSNSENLYYSFDINDIHFVSVTSEFAMKQDTYKTKEFYDQFKSWFKDDLSSTAKKWKIVYLHRPLYCSWKKRPRCTYEAELLRKFFEELFYEGKIDLILSGHLHNYERMYPIYKNDVDKNSVSEDGKVYNNPKYPVHLICGTGGNKEGASPNCKK
jgi:hypothetical protein